LSSAFGPASKEPSFIGPTTRYFLSLLGNNTSTSLQALYFPVPEDKKIGNEKPGLLISIHGMRFLGSFSVLLQIQIAFNLAMTKFSLSLL
jgi:hypothetical protein